MSISKNSSAQDEINLSQYLGVLHKRRKLIVLVSSAGFVLSVMISLILPKAYVAKASVLPPPADSMLATSSALTMGIGPVAGFLGTTSQADLWLGILASNSVMDAVIDKFNLREAYETSNIEKTRKELGGRLEITKSKEGIITIEVEDSSPEQAARMANAFVEELDRINRNSASTSAGRTRAFVESRLIESRKALSDIEEEIRSFQQKNRAIKLDDQSRAMIESFSTLKGTLMAKEIELETFLSYATPENTRAQTLGVEIKELKKKLASMEKGAGEDIFIPAASLPDISLKYARLLRDAKVQQTVFEMLTQQYEMSRITEAKDISTVQVLDIAKPPEVPSKPKRVLIVLFSTVSAAFISVFAALLFEYAEKTSLGQRDNL